MTRRGRPPRINPTKLLNTAHGLELTLAAIWEPYGQKILNCNSQQEIEALLNQIVYYGSRLQPYPNGIWQTIKEGRIIPKNPRRAIRYLAYSAAGEGIVSPKRSRDICRNEDRKPQEIPILPIKPPQPTTVSRRWIDLPDPLAYWNDESQSSRLRPRSDRA